jgi:hypothetical protein
MQQSSGARIFASPDGLPEEKFRLVFLGWNRPPQLPVGDVHNMTVSWRRRFARIWSAAGG